MKTAVTILVCAWFVAAAADLRAGDDARTEFPGSLAPVPAQARALTARQPVGDREPVTFQVALRLTADGMAPEADYQRLVRWLQGQGLTVNASAFPQHTEIEAAGTTGQVSKALAVRFGRVEAEGRACVCAVSVPSLPAALSGAVIGINGLQPFLHKRRSMATAR